MSQLLVHNLCVLHPNQKLTHYCQSCSDVVCQECIHLQPHSNSFHIICLIQQKYQECINVYQGFKISSINPLRYQIGLKISDIKQIQSQQLQKPYRMIMRDIEIEFQAIGNRLQKKSTQIILQKQTNIKYCQKYINILNDIAYSFQSTLNNPYKFMMLYLEMDKHLLQLQSIQLGNQSNEQITSSMLPRQVAQVEFQVQKLPRLKEKNNFINAIIAKMSNYYQEELKKYRLETNKESKRIQHIYNDMKEEILALKSAKICAFCACAFSYQSCNDPCSQNSSYKSQPIYPDLQISQEIRRFKMHFWVQARTQQRLKPKLSLHPLLRVNAKKQYQNSLKDLQMISVALHRYQIDHGCPSSSEFISKDVKKTGTISKIAFTFIMTKKFQISQTATQCLIQQLMEEDGSINYEKLSLFLQDTLKPYKQYLLFEEEQQKGQSIAPKSANKFRY